MDFRHLVRRGQARADQKTRTNQARLRALLNCTLRSALRVAVRESVVRSIEEHSNRKLTERELALMEGAFDAENSKGLS